MCTRFWWEGRRPLGRPRMDLRDIGWVGGCILDLVSSVRNQWQDLVNMVMNLRVVVLWS
jgi:hypothetical protein